MNGFVGQLLVVMLLLASSLVSYAQQDPAQLRFDHITVNDGLSHSDAMAVAQDTQGFIWVGTNNGVDRYDGYRIKPYLLPIDNANGLSNNRVRALHVDSAGGFWAGTEGGASACTAPTRIASCDWMRLSCQPPIEPCTND